MADRHPQDIGGGPEPLLAEEPHIHEVYLDDLQAAIEQAVAAERLGFCWRLDSYMCPVGQVDSGDEQQEYRLVIWKHLVATRLPMLAVDPPPAAVDHQAPAPGATP